MDIKTNIHTDLPICIFIYIVEIPWVWAHSYRFTTDKDMVFIGNELGDCAKY